MSKYDVSRFKGIFVELHACYDANGDVNLAAVKKLARMYADVGVSGLYVCGSTGDGMLQTAEERKRITEAVLEEVGGDLTIIVHVGAPSTREAVELAKHAAAAGCHATSAVPSIYYHLSEASIQAHWTAITEAADVPFFIYNIPTLTGYSITSHMLDAMLKNERVAGIKNSSEIAHDILRLKQAGGRDFVVFNGPDEQYLAGRAMGADAGIGGTYGAMPELYLKLESCIQAGNLAEAQKWQNIITPLIYRLCGFPSMTGAVKAIIRKRGIDVGQPRLPFLPVADDHPGIQELFDDIMRYTEEAKK